MGARFEVLTEEVLRLAVTREAWKKDASEFRRRYEEHAGVVKGRM